jgi:L-ribulose-5-phosphate 3-epimerase
MLKCISYWTLGGFDGGVPVAEAARTARDLGYEAIELCYGAGELVPTADPAVLARIRKDMAEIGIATPSLCSGNYWAQSLASPNESERQSALAFTRSYIECAAALGAGAVLVMPGTVDVPWDPSRPVVPAKFVWERSRASIQELIPTAENYGVVLALENVWSKFLTGPFEMAAYVDSFDSPWVKCYFDAGNAAINGYAEHWIEILGDRIARVHIKGFNRREGGGTLADFTESLLDCSLDWKAIMAALRGIGYKSTLTAEMLVSARGLPDLELARKVSLELDRVLAS